MPLVKYEIYVMSVPRESLSTRSTLLARLKDLGNSSSWSEFHALYYPLVLAMARKEGLNEEDAKDVAQETFHALVEALPRYHYDPARARFKTWLFAIIANRMADFFRQRDGRTDARARVMVRERPATAVLEAVAAQQDPAREDVFEQEWRRSLLLRALAELKKHVAIETYQVMYLLIHGQSPADVARKLGVSRGSVYLTRHRTEPKLRRLVKRLETEFGEGKNA